MSIPYGYCLCGCGQKTNISKQTCSKTGALKGEPNKYIHGHAGHLNAKERNGNWAGGTIVDKKGYVFILNRNHPHANSRGYVAEHILVAEQEVESILPKGTIIHHKNENPHDNSPENLVICKDRAHHLLLHKKAKALKICGHEDWRKCARCKQWDNPINMRIRRGEVAYHIQCEREYRRKLYKNRRNSE